MSVTKTRKPMIWIAAALIAALCAGSTGAWQEGMDIDVPFEKFVLDNGLTLIVHEDHKAPIVAVNIWYHVGSKNEKPGRTGFAHLFEHLMFNGSENFDDDYFQAMAQIGATDLNGTTNEDRTNYFQNVPTSAVDVALWMESDRMGHLVGAITQEKLDEQRGVVQNEKRQGENQPYAISYDLITDRVFPEGHPYSWTVIGSMEDLDAAALEDVQEWFRSYYGPANAVLVLAGDITPKVAKQKVEKYFGDIPSGPPVSHPQTWIAQRTGKIRETAQDRVPHARVYKVWNVPEMGHKERDHLELVASVLASGKTSRLYKRLVYDEQIARGVTAFVDSREIGSLFQIEATAQSGVDLAKVEAAVDEELARLLAEGPTDAEVERAQTEYLSQFIRGTERIGGFGGKSDILAMAQVYRGDALAYKGHLENMSNARAADLAAAARKWLADGQYALEVHPFPDFKVADAGADRSKLPDTGEPPKASFVKLQRETLANGMEIILAERHATPIVDLTLMVDAGYASDQFGAPGTARLTMDMMDEGAGGRNALQISDELSRLGAELGTGSNLDFSNVSMSALKINLDASLELFADVALRPTFPEKEFLRLQKQQLASIQAEKAQPIQMALRVMPGLMFGSSHAYGAPFSGSGTEASVKDLTRDALVSFHRTWFRPNKATLVVVGDTTMSEIKPRLEKLFQGWKKGKSPKKNIAAVAHKASSEVYLIDKPGAQQSIILAGHVAPPRGASNDIAIETMNTVLGGTFIARLNMNLREDKHWAYGAQSLLLDAQGPRPFIAFAPVQTDKTKESMVEIRKELRGILGGRPITQDELATIKDKKVMELPGLWETNDAVAASIAEMVRFGLDDGYFNAYADKVRALSVSQVSKAAEDVVRPDNLVWVVVGDLAKIEQGIRELELGAVQKLDLSSGVMTASTR